jgi:hypothetical protein
MDATIKDTRIILRLYAKFVVLLGLSTIGVLNVSPNSEVIKVSKIGIHMVSEIIKVQLDFTTIKVAMVLTTLDLKAYAIS